MKNKIIVLGAGRGQIPIINILHRYNCEVLVVSKKGNYPAFSMTDRIKYIDIRDKEKIYNYAKKEKVNGIISDQLDEAVLTAAYVSEKLGLKGIGYDVALKFTDKHIMKTEAKKIGIKVPYFICCSTLKEATTKINNSKYLNFPLIIKPVDSSSSRGVYQIDNTKELKSHFYNTLSFSKSKQVLLEQYIDGSEYVVEAYTHDYKTTNLVLGIRNYFDIKKSFIPSSTIFKDSKSSMSMVEKRILNINKKIIKEFKLPFGITHAEYIYNPKDDQIYLVEIAARGGGVFISSDLIPLCCGVNANEMLVKDLLDIYENSKIIISHGSSAYLCYLVPQGEVIKIEGKRKINRIKGVKKAYFDNIYVGMKTKKMIDKTARKGPILIQGKNITQCCNTIKEVKKTIVVKVKTNNNEIDKIIW